MAVSGRERAQTLVGLAPKSLLFLQRYWTQERKEARRGSRNPSEQERDQGLSDTGQDMKGQGDKYRAHGPIQDRKLEPEASGYCLRTSVS